MKTSPEVLFFKKVEKTSSCWVWKGQINHNGYGVFRTGLKTQRAHRYSYKIVNGDIAEGMNVLHHCDNRSCVNPDHLFLGTQRDNVIDMFKKGRSPSRKGERNSQSKLDVAAINEIRSKCATLNEMSIKYGISENHVSRIRNSRRWTHI